MHILSLRCKRPADTLQTFCRNNATALQSKETLRGGSTTRLNRQFTPFKLIV